MNQKHLFSTILVVFSFVVLFTVVSCKNDPHAIGESSTDKVTITKVTKFGKNKKGEPLKGTLGAVVFSHKTHEDMKCIDCHHKFLNPEREKKCAVCHKGDDGYETMHGLCLDCHIKKKDGPQKCTECH